LLKPDFRGRLGEHAVPLACLVFIPIVIGLIHDDWLYSTIGFMDPWYNVGYFLHYFDPAVLNGYYKEERLSWLLPGYFLYGSIGPLAANFVLHVGSLILSTTFLYLTLARLTSRWAALIAAALLCAYYPFHGSGGWDYQSVGAGVYYAITLYLLTRAAQSIKPSPWLIGAGVAFACAVCAVLPLVNMIPVLAAHYLVITQRRRTWTEALRAVGWGSIGFVGISLVFSIAAKAAGRNPIFFQDIVGIAFKFASNPENQVRWWLPWSSLWFLDSVHAAYFIGITAIAIGSSIWLVATLLMLRRPEHAINRREAAIPIMLVGQYVFLFLLWVLWQTQGQTALQPDYFAHPLIVPAFLALGVLLGNVGRREAVGLAAVLVVVVLYGTLAPPFWLSPLLARILTVIGVLLATFAAALFAKARAVLIITAFAIFLLGAPRIDPKAVDNKWHQLRPSPTLCTQPRNFFAGLMQLNHKLAVEPPTGGKSYVWWGPPPVQKTGCDVHITYFVIALTGTGIPALNTTPSEDAGRLDDAAVKKINNGDRIVGVVADRTLLRPLLARFEGANVPLMLEETVPLEVGPKNTAAYIYRVRRPTAPMPQPAVVSPDGASH